MAGALRLSQPPTPGRGLPVINDNCGDGWLVPRNSRSGV